MQIKATHNHSGGRVMNDSAIFTGLIVVMALNSCHTLMTIRRECHKNTEVIIKHIDERYSCASSDFDQSAINNKGGKSRYRSADVGKHSNFVIGEPLEESLHFNIKN